MTAENRMVFQRGVGRGEDMVIYIKPTVVRAAAELPPCLGRMRQDNPRAHPHLMSGHHARPRPHRVDTSERAVRPKLGLRSLSPPRRVRDAANTR